MFYFTLFVYGLWDFFLFIEDGIVVFRNTIMLGWACTRCTYLNKSVLQKCEMCNAPIPHSSADPSPAEESTPLCNSSSFLFSSASFVEIRMPIEDQDHLRDISGASSLADVGFLEHIVQRKKEIVQTISREVFLTDLKTSFPTDPKTGSVLWPNLWEQFRVDLPRQTFSVDGLHFPTNAIAALNALNKGVQAALATPASGRLSYVTSMLPRWVVGAAPSTEIDPTNTTPLPQTQEILLFCQQSVLALAFQMLRAEYSNALKDVHLVCSSAGNDKMNIEVRTQAGVFLTVEKPFHMVRIDERGDQVKIGKISFSLSVDPLDPTGSVLTNWQFC